ncbi:CO/xanthine dehydrogenase FAD-binding subunit [Bradyrhizobium sp. USDA 10063]
MYETIYHRASSVDEAAALFAKGEEPKYLAGGHTLIPRDEAAARLAV